MARPEEFPLKTLLRMDRVMQDSIDEWRAKQEKPTTRSEAIRELIRRGLGPDLLPG